MERLLNGRTAIALLAVLVASVAGVALWAPRPAQAVPVSAGPFTRPLVAASGPEGSAITLGLTTTDQVTCLAMVFDPPSADPHAADQNEICVGDGSGDIFGAGDDAPGPTTTDTPNTAGPVPVAAVAAAWTWVSPASGERYEGWFGTADNNTQASIAANGVPIVTTRVSHRVYVLALPAEAPSGCLSLVTTAGTSQESFSIDKCSVPSPGVPSG